MGILQDYQDQQDRWDDDHCERYDTMKIVDLADIPPVRSFFLCNDCGVETDEGDMEEDEHSELVCPSCGSCKVEHVDLEKSA